MKAVASWLAVVGGYVALMALVGVLMVGSLLIVGHLPVWGYLKAVLMLAAVIGSVWAGILALGRFL